MGRNDRDRGPPSRDVQVSKLLSRVLRHSAPQEKIELTPQGYAKISDLLKWQKAKSMKLTFEEVLDAVVENNKQRFAVLYQSRGSDDLTTDLKDLTNDIENLSLDAQKTSTQVALEKAKEDQDPRHYLIRATQGHSIKINSAEYLEAITLSKSDSVPETVVHGTYHGTWKAILATGGLKPMSRVHAHFASGPSLQEVMPEGIDGPVRTRKEAVPSQEGNVVISGMRSDAQILVYIDIKKALEAEVPFWRSENGVILSEGKDNGNGQKIIGTEYFDVVVETKEKLGLLWKDGKVAKELPEALATKAVPRGKGGHGPSHSGQKKDGKKDRRHSKDNKETPEEG